MKKLLNCTFSWNDILNSRNELYGFMAIWIILFHIHDGVRLPVFPYSWAIDMIFMTGNCGVDLFLLLSAIGLYASVTRNPLKVYYKNRFRRVGIPYLVLTFGYFLWYDFFYRHDGFLEFLANITTLNYWRLGDHPTWYVAFILIAYSVFPWLQKVNEKKGTLVLIILSVCVELMLMYQNHWLYANAERALSRVPIFLIGVIMAPVALKKGEIPLWKVLAAFLGIFVYFVIRIKLPTHIILTRYLGGILAINVMVVYSFIRKYAPLGPIYRAASWVGGLSLEIYIVHVLIMRLIRYANLRSIIPNQLFWYIVIPSATLCLTVTYDFLRKKCSRLRNNAITLN